MEQDRKKAEEEEKARLARIAEEEEAIKRRQIENAALEAQLEQILPQVREADLIAAELGRDVRFNSQLTGVIPDFGVAGKNNMKKEFLIKVDNREDGVSYLWNADKFTNRIFLMREKYNEYVDNLGKIPDFSNKDEDPFYDVPQPIMLGKSYLELASLSYMIDSDKAAGVYTTNTAYPDGTCGTLYISYTPCDADGTGEPPDELLVEEAEELLGKQIHFKVNVEKA